MSQAAENRKTQGRKGYKMPRLNISITPSAYEYLRIMGGISGKTLSQYISDIIEKDAAANAEVYERAKELISNAR